MGEDAFDLAVPVMVTGSLRTLLRVSDFFMVSLALGPAAVDGLEAASTCCPRLVPRIGTVMCRRTEDRGMSDATKIVLGTIAIAGVVVVAIVLNHALA